MIVAGIGARASATAEEIVAAVIDACGRAGIAVEEVGRLSGLDRPETSAALASAGVLLGNRPGSHDSIEIALSSAMELQQEGNRCATLSDRSMAATGVPSVAEAAALAGAGPEGMLLLHRIAFATVTVALAIGPGGTAP
jgi:cobalt-precorrin 5A hydrolase